MYSPKCDDVIDLKSVERALRKKLISAVTRSAPLWRRGEASESFERAPPLPACGERVGVRGQGLELRLISAHFQPSCPALCRASTPDNRETHRAEAACSAHVLTFASCRRVDGRDKRGHDAVR